MGLFLLLLCCAAAALGVRRRNSRNSRFGVFNSRLGAKKFPFSRPRELVGKRLISLAVFGTQSALLDENTKKSRFYGNKPEPAG
jgi:hypothetical protein